MKPVKIIVLFLALSPILWQACKKSSSPAPDAASAVQGTYMLSHLEEGTAVFALPVAAGPDTTSATITATKITGTSIKLVFNTIRNSNTIQSDTSAAVSLDAGNAGTYNMTSATTGLLGTIGNRVINVNGKLKLNKIVALGKIPVQNSTN